ncbi:MAG TPA: HDOD domain-containing protein [Novimethylophilus sp.]|uniref:HDOD domain-containing protein n=1 Tax=Novimethylophilus sp. TaxID=2137426 RepID=UPI002F3EDE75
MSQTIDEWVSQLAPLELPVLRTTLQAIKKLQNDPDVSAARIAAAVLPDPMMALKLMRLANASRHGEFAQRIATAEHAVMMLGLSTTFSRLSETAVLEDVLPPHAQHGLLCTTARASHAAIHARAWAVQRLDTSIEEVYIAAVLYGMAEMTLWVAEPERMVELAKTQRKLDWKQAEQNAFGFPLVELSRALAERWNMPPLVTSAMQQEITDVHVRPRCVMLANRLIKNAETGWYGPAVAADLEEIAAARRQAPDEVAAQVHSAAADVARRYIFADVVPAATWLPMLAGEWPDEEPSVVTTDDDPFQAVMKEMSMHLDDALSLHDLLVLVMRGMRDGIGLKRVVFALLTQDRTELKAKYTFGAEQESPLKSFRFDMRQKHLFSALMGKQQAIWMSDENRIKYAAYLNDEVMKATTGHEFYAMSLSVQGKMIGLFYGDRAGTGERLDAASFEKFKLLCAQAAQSMVLLAKPRSANA